MEESVNENEREKNSVPEKDALYHRNDEESKTWQNNISTDNTQISSSPKLSRIYVCKQHAASFLANIPSLSTGIALAWTTPAVPVLLGQVADDPQPLRLTLEQASWVGAMMPLTSLAGALVAGPLAERVGRKGALLLGAAPTLLGWILMTFAGTSLWALLAGRTLIGFSVGAVSGPAALYCEEIADVRVRGALGTYQFMMNVVGSVWILSLGTLLPYFWFTSASLLPSFIFVLTFCWMPESPAYLYARGRKQDAYKAMRWFRGPDIDCDVELRKLLASKSKTSTSTDITKRSFLSLWSRRPWRSNALRSVFILLILMFLQQMSGISLFLCYTVQVFEKTGGNISSHLASLVTTGLGTCSGVLLSTFIVDRVGRRLLLVISFGVMGISLFCLLIYTFLKNNGSNLEDYKWIPLVLFLIYFPFFGLGVGPVPWFLTAEMLPMYAKGWASAVVVCMNRFIMFLVVKESPLMLLYAGEIPTYAMFCIFCLLSVVFVIKYIPETKGKPKDDILLKIGGVDP